jgi:hypothetical protein
MNVPNRISRWIRTVLGLAAAGSAVASPSTEPSGGDDTSLTYRLTWFELQIDPFVYRFAYSPGHPLFISLSGKNGEKGSVLLVRQDHVPEVYDQTIERLNALIRASGVLQLPMERPNQAFSDEATKANNVHLRFRFADNTAWASVYAPDAVPPEVSHLLDEAKFLARELVAGQANQKIDGDQALEHLKSDEQSPGGSSPNIVLKIRISATGVIAVDERIVTITELEHALNELKQRKGVVWYHREAGASVPSPETVAIIKQVLDAVMARELPIKLQEEKY